MRNSFQKTFTRLLVLCLVVAVADLGFGQTRNDLEASLNKLKTELESTGRLIHSLGNQEAKSLLKRARTLGEEANTAITDHKFALAGAKIKLAFSLLEQAVKLTLNGPVNRLRRELNDLMRKADNLVIGTGHKESERILQEAKKNQRAAERAFVAKNFKRAVDHYRASITLTQRAIDQVKQSPLSQLDRIKEEKNRFETLRARAQEVLEKHHNPKAQQILNQALRLFESADEALRNRKFESAKSLFNQSILLLLRAMDIAGGQTPSVNTQVQTAVTRLQSLIGESRRVVFRSNNPRAKLLFERALRFEREAELAAKESRNYEALWKVNLAENMIKRAKKIASGRRQRKFSAKLSEEIANTRQDIKSFNSRVDQNIQKDAPVLIKMAQFAVNRADKAHKAGFNRLALEAVLAAQRFLSKAEAIAKNQDTGNVTEDLLRVRLNQLNLALQEAERRVANSDTKWNGQLINSAKDIRRMAEESLQKGNYRAADEGIQVSFELIRKSLKNISIN